MLSIPIRVSGAFAFVLFPLLSAHADTKCAAWSAAMGAYEEGREMSAGNCGFANKKPAYIEIRCGGANVLMFRLEPGSAGKTAVADPAPTAAFIFETNSGAHELVLKYEGLDGMYAGYYPYDHAFFQALKSGKQLDITDKSGRYPVTRVALKNSRRAIDAVIEHCQKK